ncbi:hypothetical protein AEAC466_19330 [Asticcacaulis sp. AC466]|uniref:response regulator n=1 Tax=Asticcacaulis sp. AC466 TaxID=1282362 RepID=UPI0003C3AF93|nr:response regulator [Asticcacaulis sp. AC466]ESQ82072.1 hypothetical protein AEAC466_19330 [Asticcacaulis sp. AC466]
MGKILLVEDEPLLRFVIVETLRDANLDVVDFCSADDALAYLVTKDDVDLIFTDINMPGAIDGLGLAHAVKEDFPRVKVILTSGRSRSTDELAGLPFISKPYIVHDVIETIRATL